MLDESTATWWPNVEDRNEKEKAVARFTGWREPSTPRAFDRNAKRPPTYRASLCNWLVFVVTGLFCSFGQALPRTVTLGVKAHQRQD
jgi:hypothetical protein